MTKLADDLNAYLAYREATDWSPASVVSNRSLLAQAVRYLARRGHRRWATVQPADLDGFVLSLQARGLARSSRDHHAWALRGLGAWLLATGRVLLDPTMDVAVLDDDEVPLPPAPLSQEQVAALFAALPSEMPVDLRNRLHVELLYSCALRSAEARMLDVSDLDFIERSVLVRDGKNGFSRLLPMFGGVHAAARDYLAVRRTLLHGPDHGALLLGERGRRIHPLTAGTLLRAASRSLGFRVHPHLLRHSLAVHLLRGGADIRAIQEMLGHADLDTTRIYLRLVPVDLREDYDNAMPPMPVDPPSPRPA